MNRSEQLRKNSSKIRYLPQFKSPNYDIFGHEVTDPVPHTTISVAFHKLIDYLTYFLHHKTSRLTIAEGMKISHINCFIEVLYLTLESFYVTVPIRLLKFLSIVSESFDSFGACKAAAVQDLTYYL